MGPNGLLAVHTLRKQSPEILTQQGEDKSLLRLSLYKNSQFSILNSNQNAVVPFGLKLSSRLNASPLTQLRIEN